MMTFLKAARPQTLVASLCPILCTYFMAVSQNSNLSLTSSSSYIVSTLQCLLIAFCLQISTNYFNDYYDWMNGADDNRVGPARYSRNDIVRGQLFKAGVILLVIAFLLMTPLFWLHWLYIPLGLSSLYFSYGYTGGLYPLAYNRLGELFVFLYFGVLIVLGTFHVLTKEISHEVIKLCLLFGIINTVIIALNNFRDLESDILVNKHTLAGLLGKTVFKFFLVGLILSQGILDFYFLSIILFLILLLFKLFFIFMILKTHLVQQRAEIFKFGIMNMLLTTGFIVSEFL